MNYINQDLNNWIEEHKEDLVAAVQGAVRHKSVKDTKTARPGAPFGKDIRECLDYVLLTALKLGFSTCNMDGYCGYVEYGEGEEILGVLAHLDVVPEGEGWKYPPYGAEIHDGCIWGRGVLDDKGAGIAALYGLKAIKESGWEPKRRVRIIFGCDEETGMACLEHYCEYEELPALCFSPDAGYPLVNSEKNICGCNFSRSYDSGVKFTAGTVSNAVAGKACATVKLSLETVKEALKSLPEQEGFTMKVTAGEEAGETEIEITGLASHAAWPEGGRNAILRMLEVLSVLPLAEEDKKTAEELHKLLGYCTDGSNFGISCEDASGALTLCIGVMDWDEKGINRLSVDIRAPITATEKMVKTGLVDGMKEIGMTVSDWGWSQGYYMDPECELVSTLMGVYNQHTGTESEPMAIGGGTYARHLQNAVAFGPERPGDEALAHMPNEYMKIDDLVDDAKIYADAIAALAFEKKH